MTSVSDDFLLQLGGISATLLGFFVVGVFFFVQRGAFPQAADEARRYLRAATMTVILLYGIALFVSIALVVFPLTWVAAIYLVGSFALVWSVTRTSLAVRHLHRALGTRVVWQTAMWAATVTIVGLPWILGGLGPGKADLASGILGAAAVAFASSASLVVSAFDISGMEAAATARPTREDTEPRRSPGREAVRPADRGEVHEATR